MPYSNPTGFDPAAKGPGLTLDGTERVITASGRSLTRSVTSVTSGQWYVEFTRNSATTWMFGLSSSAENLSFFPGQSNESIGLYNGSVYLNNSIVASASLASTGVFGLAIDADARTVRWFDGSGNTTGDVGFPWLGAIYLAGGADGAPAGSLSLNAGQDSFVHAVPSGYTPGFELQVLYGLEGTVMDDAGAPAARTVRAYLRSSGALAGAATSSGTTGAFLILPRPNTTDEHVVVVYDDVLNALVYDRVVPA